MGDYVTPGSEGARGENPPGHPTSGNAAVLHSRCDAWAYGAAAQLPG
jgi:hypothetical protein